MEVFSVYSLLVCFKNKKPQTPLPDKQTNPQTNKQKQKTHPPSQNPPITLFLGNYLEFINSFDHRTLFSTKFKN